MLNYDVIVIGGGAGGMAAAIESDKTGAKTLLIERDDKLGGILNQCIHNGFGLHYFCEELTGPEYANKFEKKLAKTKVDVMLNTFVKKIDGKNITIVNENGCQVVTAKSIVIAMGCREKTAGSINLAGTRPVGIYTAGQVQRMVNLYGKMVGKRVVIVGSGDIGLIMARRLTFEGAKVLMVAEIMSFTSGLSRNVQQCIKDFNIPLLFNTSITRVVGTDRVEGVYYAPVDEKYNICGREKYIKCDCVILSVGLTPETSIIENLKLNPVTNGAFVNEYRELIDEKGVFMCGNNLHVHDLVDNVSIEGEIAGHNAGLNALGKLKHGKAYNVKFGDGIRYVLPSIVFGGKNEEVTINFRVGYKIVKKFIVAYVNGKLVNKKYCMSLNPGEMQSISINKDFIDGDIEVKIVDGGFLGMGV